MEQKAKQLAEATTGTAAAGNTALPSEFYTDYLLTHDFLMMNYADWTKVIGTIYVIALLLKTIGFFRLCRWLFNKAMAHIQAK